MFATARWIEWALRVGLPVTVKIKETSFRNPDTETRFNRCQLIKQLVCQKKKWGNHV